MQKEAIQRLDDYIEHFRKTGDQKTLLPEILKAEEELTESATAFKKSGNLPAAALSLIKLGDAKRFQNKWNEALRHYQEAEALAGQAGHKAHQAMRHWSMQKTITPRLAPLPGGWGIRALSALQRVSCWKRRPEERTDQFLGARA